LSQLTLHAPLQLAMHEVLSLFDAQLALHWPSQSAWQSTLQLNLPGSSMHLPVQPAIQLPSHSTLGTLSQLASQLAASLALQVACTLAGVHIAWHCAVGGMTAQSASARTSIRPQSDKSARATAA
jgi:hypothetical protein